MSSRARNPTKKRLHRTNCPAFVQRKVGTILTSKIHATMPPPSPPSEGGEGEVGHWKSKYRLPTTCPHVCRLNLYLPCRRRGLARRRTFQPGAIHSSHNIKVSCAAV